MFVRLDTVSGDKTKVDDTALFFETVLRPRTEATAGNEGFATVTAAAYGYTLAASYWTDAQVMSASDESLAALREQSAEAGGGTLSSEGYQVPVDFRGHAPSAGALLELSRFEFRPGTAGLVAVTFEAEMLPGITTATGLCGVQLMTDVDSCRGIVATTWDDDRSARGFWLAGGQLRARVARRTASLAFIGTDFYNLVNATQVS